MHVFKHEIRAAILGAAVVSLAACGDRRAADRAAADPALSRDLTLASAPTAQPTFQDTAIAPAPAAATRPTQEPPAPAPVRKRVAPQPRVEAPQPVPQQKLPPQPVAQAPAEAPAAAPARGEIGTGTGFALTSDSKVCTNSNMPGDKLVATLNSAVTGSNGAVIPAGANVVLEVASASAGQNGENPRITFRVRSIVVNDKTYSVAGDVTTLDTLQRTKVASGDPNGQKKKVIGGAIAGALIGQMIGHNTKGTVIGAAAGAAAGAAISKSGEKWEGCLPSGAALRLTLSEPVVM
ncbi:MAG TPA: YMGG-like glycine zipper-containing protein [Gemmatimonadaceae bacterium]|nr:YMGG-like glycine zipper-containing protein [Gemmatimonadaceae bacterium]